MFDKVEKLFEVAGTADKAELGILNNAVIDRMNAYKKEPTKAHKQDWDAAKDGLKEIIERLWPVYFPEAAAASGDAGIFHRQKDAFAWLKEKGYKVSSGKFSNDCNNGKVTLQPGGKAILLADLVKYAATLDIDSKKMASAEQRSAQKDELDIDIKKEQLKKIQAENRKEDRRWILREESEEQAAALLVILRDTLRHHGNEQTHPVILAAGGDPSRALEVEAAIQQIFTLAFNEIANSREFNVLFGEVEGDDGGYEMDDFE